MIITLVVILALPVAGAFVLKAMFPPERLREIAEPQLEKRIARDVTLGAVRLKVFPNIAIRLSDVRIANPPDGFSDTPAIRMDALDLRLQLLPLLRRRFELSQVRLLHPQIRYEVAADGSNNLAGILAVDSVRDRSEEKGAGASASNFDIRDLVVVDGGLAYLNSASRRAARFTVAGRLSVDRAERAGGPLASDGGFRLSEALMVADGRDTTRLPDTEIAYRAVFEPGGTRIAVPELTIRAAGLALDGEAASRKEGDARTVRVDLASEEFGIADLLDRLPAGMAPDTLDVDGRASLQLRYAGQLGSEPGPQLQGSATYSRVSISTPGRGEVADAVAGTAAFTTERLNAPDVKGRLFGRPFEARVEVTGLTEPNPRIEGHLSGEFALRQVNDFREGAPLPVEGTASAAIDFGGPAKSTARWNVSGPVRLSNVAYAAASLGQPVTIVSGTIQLTGSGVRGEAIPLRIGGSDLAVSFSSDQLIRHFLTEEGARGRMPPIEFSARSNRLAAEDLRRGPRDIGYSDLLKARLAGQQVGGRAPEVIARERYRRPDLSGVRASGTVAITEWVNPPTNASNVSFRVDLADGVLDVTQVAGTVYGGQLSGGGKLDLGAPEPPYELEYDLHLQGAGAGSLLERWTRLGRALTGRLDFDITGSTPLDDAFLPVTAALTASGRTNFVEGRFEDFGLPNAIRSKLDAGGERIRGFRDLGGPFEIRQGQFFVRNWTFATGELQGAVGGSAGLAGLLDLDLALMVPPALLRDAPFVRENQAIGQLVSRVLAGEGGESAPIPLRLKVGGTMRSPSLSLDSEALTSSLRGRITGAGRDVVEQKAKDRLEEAAGGLLDRLRGAPRDSAAPPDSASRDTVSQ